MDVDVVKVESPGCQSRECRRAAARMPRELLQLVAETLCNTYMRNVTRPLTASRLVVSCPAADVRDHCLHEVLPELRLHCIACNVAENVTSETQAPSPGAPNDDCVSHVLQHSSQLLITLTTTALALGWEKFIATKQKPNSEQSLIQ